MDYYLIMGGVLGIICMAYLVTLFVVLRRDRPAEVESREAFLASSDSPSSSDEEDQREPLPPFQVAII